MMLLWRCVMLVLAARAAAAESSAGPEAGPGPLAEADAAPPPEPPPGPAPDPEPEPGLHHPEGLLPGGPALRSPRVVHTRSGPLQGLILSMDGAGAGQRSLQPVEAFLGVPYATPPVGGNRFSPTRAPSPWDEVRVADRVRPACPQRHPDLLNETAAMERMPRGRLLQLRRLLPYLRAQSEDCLYLNIYTPAQGEFHRLRLRCRGQKDEARARPGRGQGEARTGPGRGQDEARMRP
ncbi:neuroligin-2-like [Frankliniella occidentalis]|uniref:Neuroligin-2-like n=1 Tax=Frankliniella occidentalis TaxID=133901 RepID=A0A9C6WL11_FRAOC|nr:neuroligin-2-like [Frankliniella occidentalis]